MKQGSQSTAGGDPGAAVAGARGEGKHVRPFLVWPVARREFYSSISIALLPALAWGVIIFGFRAAEVILLAVLGATVAHKLLKYLTRRGQNLLYSHTLVSALLLATLSMPFWPPLIMLAAGALLTGLLWVFEGPGRDRIHPAVVMALALGLVVIPLMEKHNHAGPARDAVLARDRLFMGDIFYSATEPTARWPRSYQINGHDGVYMQRPSTVVAKLIPQLYASIRSGHEIDSQINQAFVSELPGIDLLLLGVRPGYIGVASGLGLLVGGLYLGYRNVLRARSVMLYLLAVIVGLAVLSFMPADLAHLTTRSGIGALWRCRIDTVDHVDRLSHVGNILTLLFYQFFSGDVLFAAVIVLALPGTEPLTAQGRRGMLILAGLLTPLIQLGDFPIPVATTMLLFLQPFNPVFDALLARRSWLNR